MQWNSSASFRMFQSRLIVSHKSFAAVVRNRTSLTSTISSQVVRRRMTDSKPLAPHPPTGTNTDWEGWWEKGIEKKTRWDIGEPEPELVFELAQAKNGGVLAPLLSIKPQARALVPGCGRGYAVAAFGDAGLRGVGLELSRTAVDTAKAEHRSKENAEFVEGNFFEADIGTFDAIFDSTFLCAISPTAYRSWAKRMNELLNPAGFLIMQLFPVSLDPAAPEIQVDGPVFETEGPPFRLTVKAVHELLKPYPLDLVLFRETPQERSARSNSDIPGSTNKEYLMVWAKREK